MATTYPSDQELLARYGDVLDNIAVQAVSLWQETNHDEPFDDVAYLAKVEADGPAFAKKIDEVLAGI